MRLLTIESSKLIALFNVSRPDRQPHVPEIVNSVAQRYSFSVYPTDFMSTELRERMEFRLGVFKDGGIESLEIFSDGVVIKSQSNSSILDDFLQDLLDYIRESWGIEPFKTHSVDRMYESHIVFQSNKAILRPIDDLQIIGSMISEFLSKNSNLDAEYLPFGLALSADQAKLSGMKPSVFRLERRLGFEFRFDQYVSFAPLTTDQNVKLIEAIESLV